MRKTALGFTFAVLFISVFVLFSLNNGTVHAQPESTIQSVNHTIGLLGNGYVFINDTVTLNATGQQSFPIGFPFKYGQGLLRCDAYSTSEVFPVNLNVPMKDRVGFYGVKVDFPHGAPSLFTVQFVLDNRFFVENPEGATGFGLDFPGYPTLVEPAGECNVTILLPPDSVVISNTTEGTSYRKVNLPEFTHSQEFILFQDSGGNVQIIKINELSRQLSVSEFGGIVSSDSYYITNKQSESLNFTNIPLPQNVSSVTAQDQFGRTLTQPIQVADGNKYKISFLEPIRANESTRFTVRYSLPTSYIVQSGINNFAFNISLFHDLDSYIDQTSVSFMVPEGSTVSSFEDTITDGRRDILRNVFQETATVSMNGLISFDSFSVKILYSYNPLWLSFRPTIWIWVLTIVGSVILAVWLRPKAPSTGATAAQPTAMTRLTPESLKTFTDSYEEKMKITAEIDSLETRVRKGRIPRQRYKVLRRTLETRLNTISRDLEESKQTMRGAGGKYSDLMRQLEIAEAQINEAETNIASIEAQHSRGERSLEAYRKFMSDYTRRKEEAETAISGILLRLREEIR